jgi:Clp protease
MRRRSGETTNRLNERSRHGKRVSRLVIAFLALMLAQRAQAETFEFEGPYAVRVLHQGSEIEISGTFSWALPQQVGVALAEAPEARLVRLDSPGGHIKAALEVADMIHARHLDTYVGRMCASACTIVFLAGHHRFATEAARLGFHQAHGPGLTPADSNLLLRLAYQNYSLPPAFISHVLRTPPQDLWVPDLAELRKAGVVTDIAPTGAIAASLAAGPTGVHGN